MYSGLLLPNCIRTYIIRERERKKNTFKKSFYIARIRTWFEKCVKKII